MSSIKKLRRFFFRLRRKLSIELLNKNIYAGKINIYLTLRCNYDCPYCVDNYNKPDFDGYTYKLKTPREWADKINTWRRDVVFTGGEPFLYKVDGQDLVSLIHFIDPTVDIDVYTNLGIALGDRIRAISRPVRMLVSFHPYEAKPEIFFPNIDALMSNKNISFTVHAVDAMDNLQHVNIPLLKQEMERRSIPVLIDKDQGFEGSERRFKLHATCDRRIVLLAPDGTRYQCVGKLTRRADHLENVFESALQDDRQVVDCYEYGYCAPCDWLGETKIEVHDKIPIIPTVRSHIHKSYNL